MNRCRETALVQDWLDGTLAPEAAARFETHRAGCPECEAEVAAYRAVFAELRALPLLDPRPELFERIMDEVLPQHAPRWVKVLGWTYAGAFAASVAAIGSAFVLPAPNAWLRGIAAAATRSVTGAGTFVLRSVSDGLARAGEAFAGEGAATRTMKLMWARSRTPSCCSHRAAIGVRGHVVGGGPPSGARGGDAAGQLLVCRAVQYSAVASAPPGPLRRRGPHTTTCRAPSRSTSTA
jgi:hypothetical protein